MTRLEDLVRQTLVDHEDDAPDDLMLLSGARERAVRRRARRRAVAVAAAAVVLVAGGIAGNHLATGRAASPVTGLAGSPRPAATTGTISLVTHGACAGLSVTAQLPGHPTRWRIGPGSDANLVTMSANAVMWLQAQGPCVPQLRFHIDGSGLQGPDPTAEGTFDSDGTGLIVSHPDATGRVGIELRLQCPAPAGCATDLSPVAVITVEVTPPIGPTAVQDPQPSR
jgi:hypothetical protein